MSDSDMSAGTSRAHALGVGTYRAGMLAHCVLLATFAIVQVWPLVWFNVGSIAAWYLVGILHRANRIRLAIAVGLIEIIAHAIFATIVVGLETGIHMAIPVFAGTYLGFSGSLRPTVPIAALAVWAVSYGILFDHEPWVTLAPEVVRVFAIGSGLIVFAGVGIVMAVLARAANRAESKLALAHEQAEELLQRELAHQVAERSRELGAALSVPEGLDPTALATTQFSSRYRVVELLGKGTMGAVFEVERLTDSRRLALKVMTSGVSREHAARFAREAEIGARIRHANVVSIVDIGVVPGGAPFLVMELVTGGSLDALDEHFGDAKWALPILRDTVRGLAALHEAGVVHRDLKPANVLLDETGNAKVSDFGIARVGIVSGSDEQGLPGKKPTPPKTGARNLTQTGMWLGTPAYMAPEAALGGREVGAPADIFAFGLMAYEMLTGLPPFHTPPVFLVLAGQSLPSPRPLSVPNLDSGLSDAIQSCLASDPMQRPTASALCRVVSTLESTPAPRA